MYAMDYRRRPVDSGSLQNDTQSDTCGAAKKVCECTAHASAQAEYFQGKEADSYRWGASEFQGTTASQDLQHGQSTPRLQACGCDRVGAKERSSTRGNDSGGGEPIPPTHPGEHAADDGTATDSPYIRTRNLPGAQRALSLATSADEVTKASIEEAKTRLRQLLTTVHSNKHELSDERKRAILASTCTVVESIRSQLVHQVVTQDTQDQFLKLEGGPT